MSYRYLTDSGHNEGDRLRASITPYQGPPWSWNIWYRPDEAVDAPGGGSIISYVNSFGGVDIEHVTGSGIDHLVFSVLWGEGAWSLTTTGDITNYGGGPKNGFINIVFISVGLTTADFSVYINGTQFAGGSAIGGGALNTPVDFWLGHSPSDAFAGYLAEFAIYSSDQTANVADFYACTKPTATDSDLEMYHNLHAMLNDPGIGPDLIAEGTGGGFTGPLPFSDIHPPCLTPSMDPPPPGGGPDPEPIVDPPTGDVCNDMVIVGNAINAYEVMTRPQRNPDPPGTDVYLEMASGDTTACLCMSTDGFFKNPITTVISVKLNVYRTLTSGNTLNSRILLGGTDKANLLESSAAGPGWVTVTWNSGDLTQGEINDLQMCFDLTKSNGSPLMYAAYFEFTVAVRPLVFTRIPDSYTENIPARWRPRISPGAFWI